MTHEGRGQELGPAQAGGKAPLGVVGTANHCGQPGLFRASPEGSTAWTPQAQASPTLAACPGRSAPSRHLCGSPRDLSQSQERKDEQVLGERDQPLGVPPRRAGRQASAPILAGPQGRPLEAGSRPRGLFLRRRPGAGQGAKHTKRNATRGHERC